MIEDYKVLKMLAVPASSAWDAIAGIGGLDRWFPILESCRVEGVGIGAQRVMGMVGGGLIRDLIEEIDHDARRFRYRRTESPFPVKSYVGTVEIRDAPGGGTEFFWCVTVDVEPKDRDALGALIRQALSDGIDGLEKELLGG